MMVIPILVIWGCVPEITRGCLDMTNASSTYLSIAIGAVVGALISWWVYKIQKNTTFKQEETLRRINDLEESHDKVLRSIEQFQNHQERVLIEILTLDKKIDAIIGEKK
jgi:membrane protein DedA with SNARE-associated domain